MSGLITVVLIGHADARIEDNLRLDSPDYEASEFNVVVLNNDADIEYELAKVHANVIFTFGDLQDFDRLGRLGIEVRRRWTHFEDVNTDLLIVARSAMGSYIDVSTKDRFPELPLVSVFTPSYKTGVSIIRVYESLVLQSYRNWEWVVYDDSPDDKTFDIVAALAGADHRVKVFKSSEPCGRIGEVKRRCCGLARGSIFVELDHDDELTSNCLSDIVEAFNKFPEAGFAYTDCAEVLDNGENATYGETYAFGYGSYRYERYGGREYAVSNYPSINSKTVRHIVGMPNHARAWRRDAYYAAGGHGTDIHVADDYELCIRTFLTTRMVHIKRFGYIQHISTSGSNTQRVRNKEIQRLVRYFAGRYESEIHERFAELDIDDFMRTDAGLDWSVESITGAEANLTLD